MTPSAPAGIGGTSTAQQEDFSAEEFLLQCRGQGKTGPQLCTVYLASAPSPAPGTETTITSGSTSNDKGRTGSMVGHAQHLVAP